MICSCISLDLFKWGCRCGAFENEKWNHLWFNGRIYVIAKTEDDAISIAESELAGQPDFSPMWIVGDGSGWRQLDEEESVTLSFSDLTTETRTASDWAKMYNQGYLASV